MALNKRTLISALLIIWLTCCAEHIVTAETIYVANYLGNNITKYSLSGTNLGGAVNTSFPSSIALDTLSNLYVIEKTSTAVKKFSSTGASAGELNITSVQWSPTFAVCDSNNNVFVADAFYGRLYKFSSSGTSLGVVSYTGIGLPTGMTIDASNNIYVANAIGIEKFSPAGADLGAIISVGPGVQALACDKNGYLYISVPGVGSIDKYTSSGVYLGKFALTSIGPSGIAFDSAQNLYAANPGNSIIEKFSFNGTDLGVFLSNGVNLPLAIAIAGASAGPVTPWPTATDLGGGWKSSTWFGMFNAISYPWIFHNEHGFMYVFGTDPSSIWMWTPDIGFLWTGSSVYPFIWSDSGQAWLWYVKDSKSPRLFFNYSLNQWQQRNP